MRIRLIVLVLILMGNVALYAHPIVQVNYKVQINQQEKTVRISTSRNIAFMMTRHLISDFDKYDFEYKRLIALSNDEFLLEAKQYRSKFLNQITFGFDGKKVEGAEIDIQIGSRKPFNVFENQNVEMSMHSDDLNAEIIITCALPEDINKFYWQNDDEVMTDILIIKTDDANEAATVWVPPFESKELSLKKLPNSFFDVVTQYIYQGFIHILPLGLDHILFMLCLFFLFDGWKSILIQVSTFTVAHSITLILVTLQFISIKPSIVEPLIALSICIVGFENMFSEKVQRYRLLVIFMFGLLHGMGFASALEQLGLPDEKLILSLVSFNIGVELGQLVVILIAYLLIGYWFFKKEWYRKRIAIPCSILISIYAFYLFSTRLPFDFNIF